MCQIQNEDHTNKPNIQVLHINSQQNHHLSKAVKLIMLPNSFTIFIASADGVGGPGAF